MKKGFTLVEILVVVGLIGIIMAVSLGSYLNSQKNARDARRKTDLEQMRAALELYRSDNGTYPTNSGDAYNVLRASLTAPVAYFSATSFPPDPQRTLGFRYMYQANASGPNTYYLCSYLENRKTTDPACPNASLQCSSGGQLCNYGVTQP